MPKWLKGIPFLAAITVLGLTAYLLPPGKPSIRLSRSIADRVKVGMTLAEVEAIVGGPPGDHVVGYHRTYWAEDHRIRTTPQQVDWTALEYECRTMVSWPSIGVLSVRFDAAGRVVEKYYLSDLAVRQPAWYERTFDWMAGLWR